LFSANYFTVDIPSPSHGVISKNSN